MSKKPTIEDVAKEADVSLTTVSLVLRDKGNIGSETRQRVQDAIRSLGYERRRKLNQGSLDAPKHLVLVVDDIGNPYFHQLYAGLKVGIGEREFVVTMASSEDSVAKQTDLLKGLLGSGVRRFAIVPASGTKPSDLRFLQDEGARHVLAVRNIEEGHLNFIGANPMLGMMLAADHLLSLSYKEIAFVGGYRSNFAYSERYAGIAAAMVRRGFSVNPDWVMDGGSTRAFGREAGHQLLQRKGHPKAMIAYNDLVAIGFMDALASHGVTPGKEFAVVGYDNIWEAAEQTVPLTTITTPAEKLGELLAEALTDDANRANGDSILNVTYPPQLIIRQSCGASLRERSDTASRSRALASTSPL